MKKFKYYTACGLGLFALTACTNTHLTENSKEVAPAPAIMLNNGEGTKVDFPLHPTTRLASAEASESGLSLFEITLLAQAAGAPPHRHTHEDEFFYVRSGRVTFMADGKQKTLSEGGFVLLPRGGWHAMWNIDKADAILLVGTSAGTFDDFF